MSAEIAETIIKQDRQDEDEERCGNFYGSSDVADDNYREGANVNLELMNKHKLINFEQFRKFCCEWRCDSVGDFLNLSRKLKLKLIPHHSTLSSFG
jgi:hypothetical protein